MRSATASTISTPPARIASSNFPNWLAPIDSGRGGPHAERQFHVRRRRGDQRELDAPRPGTPGEGRVPPDHPPHLDTRHPAAHPGRRPHLHEPGGDEPELDRLQHAPRRGHRLRREDRPLHPGPGPELQHPACDHHPRRPRDHRPRGAPRWLAAGTTRARAPPPNSSSTAHAAPPSTRWILASKPSAWTVTSPSPHPLPCPDARSHPRPAHPHAAAPLQRRRRDQPELVEAGRHDRTRLPPWLTPPAPVPAPDPGRSLRRRRDPRPRARRRRLARRPERPGHPPCRLAHRLGLEDPHPRPADPL